MVMASLVSVRSMKPYWSSSPEGLGPLSEVIPPPPPETSQAVRYRKLSGALGGKTACECR